MNKAHALDRFLDGIVGRKIYGAKRHFLLKDGDGYALVTIRNINADNDDHAIDKVNEILNDEE